MADVKVTNPSTIGSASAIEDTSPLPANRSAHPAPPSLQKAHDDGRLSIGRASGLFDPDGLEVPPVDHAVLALIPEKTASPHIHVQWEGGEHTYIGNSITLQFDSGKSQAGKTPLHLPNGLALTYGQIVALGGDFYGLPDNPISDDTNPPSRFLQAFNTLATNPAAVAESATILNIMQTEIDAVNQAIKNGQQPSTVYARLGDSLSAKWNVATGGGSPASDLYPLGRYLQLASTNWDHFGTHAVTAYTMGHGAALARAIAARNAPDPATKRAQLELAYAMNAFADHFLSDIFSAGHLRTPRKEMYEQVTPSYAGSYLTKFMHDEDSCWGLKVQNKNGQSWTAYGDKKFFDAVNATNATIVEQAVQVSASEIYFAYSTGSTLNTGQALNYIPNLAQVADWNSRANPSPLFIYTDGTTRRRTDPGNRFDYSWTDNWWGWSTIALLKSLPEFKECGNNEIPLELNANIVQLWNNSGQLGMILYAPTASGYGALWQQDDMGEGAGAVAWLPVDMNGDGKTEIVQLWNNGGQLGMVVYVPNGNGYQALWQQDDMGEGSGAIQWLTVDMNGDGKTEIVQLWDNGGQLGMVVYVPNGNGYQALWQQDDMGEGSGAAGWLPVDMNGDGKTEIVQLWNNGGQLGMVVYVPNGNGYQALWQQDDMGEGIGAIQWLTVDMNGDGKTEIVQLWDNGGQLGMVVYVPNGNGYQALWQQDDMGEGSGAVGWLTSNEGDDGNTNIIQLWNNSGRLGMVVYGPSGNGYRVVGQQNDMGEGSGAIAWITAEVIL